MAGGALSFHNLRAYWDEARRFRRAYSVTLGFLELARDYPLWLRYQKDGGSPLSDAQPWITFPAIRFLSKIMRADMRVWEYGSGGSTLFFASRAREVFSVEHDPDWAGKVRDVLRQRGWTHCLLRCVEPSEESGVSGKHISDPDAYVSEDAASAGKAFRAYATSIDEYPDAYFDIILIDGRARPSCFKHSLSKVKPGGHIIWDNTERDYYHPAMRLAPGGFRFFDFPGPTPYVRHFSKTSAWQAPPQPSHAGGASPAVPRR